MIGFDYGLSSDSSDNHKRNLGVEATTDDRKSHIGKYRR